MQEGEKTKVLGPKPNIASKPKHVPPVNLKCSRDDSNKNVCQRVKEKSHLAELSQDQNDRNVEKSLEKYVHVQRPTAFPCTIPNTQHTEYTTYYSEKCDKFKTTCETQKCDANKNGKTPTSPSTVCCSILSNTTNDCCGIIVNTAKKELNGKTLTKKESIDSNSSDSGGFKDFVQLDLTKPENEHQSHQRKISQPEFQNKPQTHQRNSSQPDCNAQSFVQNKFIANAQALAQYLPQTEQKFFSPKSEDVRQHISKFNSTQAGARAEEPKNKPKVLISQNQFQQSTRKLEELLSQRLEREKLTRKGQNCVVDGEASQDVEHKMMIQKQIQQKLHADLQQTVKQIQEIQSVELRLPQNRKWNESNRSQPAIGLKHTPKSRVSYF